MAYEVLRAAAVARDLSLVFDFLYQAAQDFGDPPDTAFDRAASRIREIESAMEGLGDVPFQGTLRPELGPGLRSVTKGRAVFYFDADDMTETVRLLAVFYGGQDHREKMLVRLLR